MPSRLITILVFGLGMLLAGEGRSEAVRLHPQDGPHADIRGSIDETGVRFGMMINLVFIDEVTDVPRESRQALDPVEEPILQNAIEAFFRTEFLVEIDGVEVEPIFSGFEMIRPGVDQLPLFPNSGMRGLLRAKFNIAYPSKSMPRMVLFRWSVFPPDGLAQANSEGVYPPMVIETQLEAEGIAPILRFSQAEPEQVWHGTGKTREERFEPVPMGDVVGASVRVPMFAVSVAIGGLALLALGVAKSGKRFGIIAGGVFLFAIAPAFRTVGVVELGSGGTVLLTEAEAKAIFEPLHANIYRAFDYQERGEVYDALARSVSGELLETLYDEIYRSLIMHDEGGAVSRVSAVRLMEVQVSSIGMIGEPPASGFTVRAKWQVDGVVYHGHSHERSNEYVADYTVVKLADGWRITGNRMISQVRLDPVTKVPPAMLDGEI